MPLLDDQVIGELAVQKIDTGLAFAGSILTG